MGMFCIISCDCYSEKLYNDYSFKKCWKLAWKFSFPATLTWRITVRTQK
jgi:hypothetical protein